MELLKSYIVVEPHSVKIYTDRNLKQEITDKFPYNDYKYYFMQITHHVYFWNSYLINTNWFRLKLVFSFSRIKITWRELEVRKTLTKPCTEGNDFHFNMKIIKLDMNELDCVRPKKFFPLVYYHYYINHSC